MSERLIKIHAIQTIDSKILSSIFSDIYNTTITLGEIDQHEN